MARSMQLHMLTGRHVYRQTRAGRVLQPSSCQTWRWTHIIRQPCQLACGGANAACTAPCRCTESGLTIKHIDALLTGLSSLVHPAGEAALLTWLDS